MIFYSLILVSAFIRVGDYFLTSNNWYISSSIEQSFALIDVVLCTLLWYVIMTSPTELDQAELVDFDDDEDGVLVLFDGRVVRNVSFDEVETILILSLSIKQCIKSMFDRAGLLV